MAAVELRGCDLFYRHRLRSLNYPPRRIMPADKLKEIRRRDETLGGWCVNPEHSLANCSKRRGRRALYCGFFCRGENNDGCPPCHQPKKWGKKGGWNMILWANDVSVTWFWVFKQRPNKRPSGVIPPAQLTVFSTWDPVLAKQGNCAHPEAGGRL